MSGYIGTQPVPQATQTRQTFVATAAQTSFATAGYSVGYLDTFLNGVKLQDGVDYTATNGSDIVLTVGAALDDTLEVVAYTAFEVLDQTFTGTTTTDVLTVTGAFTSKGIDDNAASTAMTLDPSGNLLVGTTDSTPYNNSGAGNGGSAMHSDGLFSAARDGNAVGIFNRLASDGDVLEFRKDGLTKVGSIGTGGGDLDIGTGDTAIRFNDGIDAIFPVASVGGAGRDNAVDLGFSGARFQDLYLSGGVYLGGTGAANKLDDYEEGTWTPTFISTNNGPSGITGLTVDEAVYTKIGNFVTVRAKVSFNRTTVANFAVGNFFTMGGLPFTANTVGGGVLYGTMGQCHVYESLGSNSNAWGFVALNSDGQLYEVFLQTLNGGPDTGDPIFLDMSYTT